LRIKKYFTEMKNLSRRDFIRATTAAAFTAPLIVNASVLSGHGHVAPSDKINLGFLGCGGMGTANLNECMKREDVVLTAACDIWKERLDKVTEKYKKTCKGYTDFREMLQQKGLDAVIISTPAHWHAIQAIEAAKAGKHIYLQKPMTMYLAESLAVRNAVRKHKVICQVGTQIHAGNHYRRMVELIRSGNLGDIATIRTFFVMNEAPNGIGLGNNTTTNIPKDLDWEQWVGPARMQPFNPNLVKDAFYHCFWYDFSGGWTPGMAPHITDLPIWALNLDYPTETSSIGGRYVIKDDSDAYDNQEIIWRYPNLTMTWMFSMTNSHGWAFQNADKTGVGYETGTRRRLGIYFHGTNGTLMTDYDSHILVPEGDRMKGLPEPPQTIPASPGQELEWLDCIRSGQQPLCNPEYHVKVDVPVILSLMSMKLGRSIRFDPKTEKIIGDEEASRMAIPEYRAPWKFPAEYLTV
jgi:predicted dehydrogenase